MKRIQQIQSGLRNPNWQDETLKKSLLKAIQHPNFYKSSEGQKFITSLFIHEHLVKDIHKAFKAILPGLAKNEASQIGEIYLKAWTLHLGNERIVQIIEEDCVQNFMYHCILAQRKKSKLFEPLLAFLLPFHSSKANKKVQEMVHRLWQPLLWRYLKVANAEVRCNAVQILSDAFPLEEPEAELEVRAAALEAQVQCFLGNLNMI